MHKGKSYSDSRLNTDAILNHYLANPGSGVALKNRVDGLTVRFHYNRDNSVIIKLWKHSIIKEKVKRLLGRSLIQNEYNLLRTICDTGLAPRVLSFRRISLEDYNYAMILEDIGPCVTSSSLLNLHANQQSFQDVLEVGDAILSITKRLIELKIVDSDHGSHNICRNKAGRYYRLDFEHAKIAHLPIASDNRYAFMLGNMVAMHAFAVQPFVCFTTHFAEKMRDILSLNNYQLKKIKRVVHTRMAQQNQKYAIDTFIKLPW